MIRTTIHSRRTLRRVSIHFLYEKYFKIGAGAVVAVLLMNALSLLEYGVYNLFWGSAIYLSFAASFGLMPGYNKLVPDLLYKKDYSSLLWITKWVSFFRAFSIIAWVLAGSLIFETYPLFPKIGEDSFYFLLFGASAFFVLQNHIFNRIIKIAYLHKYLINVEAITITIKALLIGAVLVYGFGLYEVLIIDILCNASVFLLTFFFYLKNISNSLPGTGIINRYSKKNLIKQIFDASRYRGLNEAMAAITSFASDFLIVGYFLGPIELAYYAFAVKVSEFIPQLLPFGKIKNTIVPTILSNVVRTDNTNEINTLFQILTKLNAFYVLPIITAFVILGKEVTTHLIDPKFLAAYDVTIILLFCVLISSLPFAFPLQLLEKSKSIITAKLLMLLNLAISIFLVQKLGINGVAIAALISICLKKAFELFLSKRYAGVSLPRIGLFQILTNCIAIGVIALLVKPYISGLFTLGLSWILITVAYMIFSKFNNAFNRDESELLKGTTFSTTYIL